MVLVRYIWMSLALEKGVCDVMPMSFLLEAIEVSNGSKYAERH